MGIVRSMPRGMAMSCPCTITSISGSATAVPGGLRRPPTIARIAAVISSGVRRSSRAMRDITALNRNPERISSNVSRPQFVAE